MTDRTELRRLLDAAMPDRWVHDVVGEIWDASLSDFICQSESFEDAALIAAAVNALPSLLDQLDAAEAALARVRELHASSGTAESQGYLPGGGYGYVSPYCTGCEASDEYAVAWPCPTIAALGADR